MTTDSTPRERPILFSGEMVRAILAGKKTQTRRPVKPQPPANAEEVFAWYEPAIPPKIKAKEGCHYRDAEGLKFLRACPYGAPGDRLWVRETWQQVPTAPLPARGGPAWPGVGDRPTSPSRWNPACSIVYRADGEIDDRWRPGIHMPRWASRLLLEVTEVRVERLQSITEEDAVREGFERREHFCRAWSEMYRDGPFAFDADPWVWVVSFQRARRGEEGR